MNKPKILEEIYRGQGLIEFALIMPVLLLMIMGIIDFGRMFYIYSAASNAVREAVRVGSTDPRIVPVSTRPRALTHLHRANSLHGHYPLR